MAYLSTQPQNTNDEKISADQIRYEEEAYFELSKIINSAIQTKDLNAFESALSSWLTTYDVDSFVCTTYKEKIKALLSTIESLKRTLIEFISKQPNFDLAKAYQKLYHIIRETKDMDEVKTKIKKWKIQYPPDKFNDYFKPKIKQITSDSHLSRTAFNQKKAYDELHDIIQFGDDLYIEDLINKVNEWKNNYNIDDFISKYSSDIKTFTDDAYLNIISKKRNSIEDIENSVQEMAFAELAKILANPRNTNALFAWTYKYRNYSFNETARNLMCREFLKYYNIPKNNNYQIPEISNSNCLSYDTFKNLNSIKKNAIINYFGILLYGQSLSSNNKTDLENLYSFSSCGIELSIPSNDIKKITVIPKEENNTESPISTSELEDPVVTSVNIIDENKKKIQVESKPLNISTNVEEVLDNQIQSSDAVTTSEEVINEIQAEIKAPNAITVSEEIIDESKDDIQSVSKGDIATGKFNSHASILNETDIHNLEKIHSAVQQAEQLKEVDSLAKIVLKKQPEISSMSFEIVAEPNIQETGSTNRDYFGNEVFSSTTLSMSDGQCLELIITKPDSEGINPNKKIRDSKK